MSLPILSISGTKTSWSNILHAKSYEIEQSLGPRCPIRREVNSDTTFRYVFERFCTDRGFQRIPRLQAVLFPPLTPIIQLVRAIGRSRSELKYASAEDSLEGLLWGFEFALIEASISCDTQCTLLTVSKVRYKDRVLARGSRLGSGDSSQEAPVTLKSWRLLGSPAAHRRTRSGATAGNIRDFH